MEENTSIPIEHKKLVFERIKKSKIYPERMLDWDEVSDILHLDANNSNDQNDFYSCQNL